MYQNLSGQTIRNIKYFPSINIIYHFFAFSYNIFCIVLLMTKDPSTWIKTNSYSIGIIRICFFLPLLSSLFFFFSSQLYYFYLETSNIHILRPFNLKKLVINSSWPLTNWVERMKKIVVNIYVVCSLKSHNITICHECSIIWVFVMLENGFIIPMKLTELFAF